MPAASPVPGSSALDFDPPRALRLARETFDIEAAALLGLKARTGEGFTPRGAGHAGGAAAASS